MSWRGRWRWSWQGGRLISVSSASATWRPPWSSWPTPRPRPCLPRPSTEGGSSSYCLWCSCRSASQSAASALLLGGAGVTACTRAAIAGSALASATPSPRWAAARAGRRRTPSRRSPSKTASTSCPGLPPPASPSPASSTAGWPARVWRASRARCPWARAGLLPHRARRGWKPARGGAGSRTWPSTSMPWRGRRPTAETRSP
mmetsp:Transcript_132168/g.358928  ORF Transcript_132168/g.358928 Transcript_132168/m.358928 type:complete len:202 (-) Transcript_132168:501-1106(-)